jgi:hypothetical protein
MKKSHVVAAVLERMEMTVYAIGRSSFTGRSKKQKLARSLFPNGVAYDPKTHYLNHSALELSQCGQGLCKNSQRGLPQTTSLVGPQGFEPWTNGL